MFYPQKIEPELERILFSVYKSVSNAHFMDMLASVTRPGQYTNRVSEQSYDWGGTCWG